MKLKTTLAWTGIFAIGFTPALLLLTLGTRDFSSPSFVFGQAAGLVGMTMFALTFILSTRARWVEELFGGLDKLLAAHGALGATSLVVLLLHPILLVAKYLPDRAQVAAIYLLPGGLYTVDLGIYALLGMIILVTLTLYARIGYHRWKVSHEFFGLIFLIAVAHVFLIRGNGSRDHIFAGYYAFAAAVSIIGIAGFTYSLVLRRFLKTKEYRIERITKHPGSWEVQLQPIGGGLQHRAGQFIFVKFHNRDVGRESHPFSIASGSGSGRITIIMKSLGDFTSRLGSLKEGDRVTVEGPYGRFHEEPGFADEVWIAGGIGITPFLGLAEDFNERRAGRVDLYYAVRSPQDFVHLAQLQRIAQRNERFRVHPWPSSTKGHLTIADIERQSAPLHGKRYYLCGPDSLKEGIRSALAQRGITAVHDERFAFR